LSRRARILVVCGLALVTALLAVAPRPLSSPIRRLANYRADGPDPLWDTRPALDGAAIRRAGELIPDGSTYWIYGPGGQWVHDLQGAGFVFFPTALPVGRASQAEYVFSYERQRLLPPGLRASRVWRVGPRIFLVKVRSG
jgi:hypothetical protein